MKRRMLHAIWLAAAGCLLLSSCARVQRVVGLTTTPGRPNPASAIALSVLSDSVYLVDPATGQTAVVAQGLVDFQAGYAAWEPDHEHLAFGNGGVEVIDTAGGPARQLNRGQSLSMPTFSPSGRELAYGDGVGLWVAASDGSDATRLSLPADLAPLGPAWRPGRIIAFQGLELDCNQPGPCASTERSDIWTIHADGSGLRQVTDLGRCDNPKWAPDGSRLLFVRHRTVKKTQHSEVWTVGPDGSALKRLLPVGGVIAADWSPDGSQIAIVRPGNTAPAKTVQVWVARADGSGLHAVSGPLPGSDATIDW